MLGGMASRRTTKRAPVHARQNVVPIDRLPRHVVRLSDANIIAWMVEATQLTVYQLITRRRPRLVHERLLAALKRERRAARKRRIAAGDHARPPTVRDRAVRIRPPR
jgi:hypothetical protein